MDITKVIIENWPKTSSLSTWIPIFIAVIALGASLYSVHLTRKSFIATHRPYVWGINYGHINQGKSEPVPSRVAYRVINAPARIVKSNVEIFFKKEQLLSYPEKNMVRFPDPNPSSEWGVEIGDNDFKTIMERAGEEKSQLIRIISIEYSSLSGKEKYNYRLEQTFNPVSNQWKDKNEKAQ